MNGELVAAWRGRNASQPVLWRRPNMSGCSDQGKLADEMILHFAQKQKVGALNKKHGGKWENLLKNVIWMHWNGLQPKQTKSLENEKDSINYQWTTFTSPILNNDTKKFGCFSFSFLGKKSKQRSVIKLCHLNINKWEADLHINDLAMSANTDWRLHIVSKLSHKLETRGNIPVSLHLHLLYGLRRLNREIDPR